MTTTRTTISREGGQRQPLQEQPRPGPARLQLGEAALVATTLAILVLVVF